MDAPEPGDARSFFAPSETTHVRGNGLSLALHRWDPDRAAPDAPRIFILHGFMDGGRSFDRLADHLTRRDAVVYALDQRGFGRSDRVPPGAYYHFPDYVADVWNVLKALALPRVCLVGHSMGGTVASLFAGAKPEAIERLVLMEGIGPPSMPPEMQIHRLRAWLDELGRPARSGAGSYEELHARLCRFHPSVDRDVLFSRVEALASERDGAWTFDFDPLHRTTSPTLFRSDGFGAVLSAITCPTLFLGGGPLGFHPEDEAERLARIADCRRVDLPEAGHMLHWTAPDDVAEAIAQHTALR